MASSANMSSNEAERTFETTITPDSIPVDFVSRWGSDLLVQRHGWIKDPAANYIRIDVSGVVQTHMIPGGLLISQKCGFMAPQRVILCYQIFDNQFNMKIVDDDGADIPYYGFHHPENQHAMSLADPTYVPPQEFVSFADEDENGEFGVNIPYEMFKHLLISDNAADDSDDDPVKYDPIHIPAREGQTEEYIWPVKVTRAIAEGRNVLHFPRYVVDNFEFAVANGEDIDVHNDDTDETVRCKFVTSTRPSGHVDKFISRGWYQYVRSKALIPGDRIVFGVENPVTTVTHKIIHR
ncbi:hypothetical protein MTR_0010s0320 [Medicago truncatula]|uniref:DNA-binding pseudobarrel domain-containing protein n=1 Tax=Medicago truncatula TaxID=3880 RepID=A0A072TK04_MEDTR|nr:hypothetical protein MTR_0010s0320 [Medicago truncatula]